MPLLIVIGLLLVCSTAEKVSVSATGTGIGIRVDGPLEAQLKQTISYAITVTNLGDFWDRNLTVTDKFPNGTSCSWKIPDLAPLSQTGYEYTISGILYAIRLEDTISTPPPQHLDNNATVNGYAYVSVSNVTLYDPIQASTSMLTVIARAVGGYSVPLEPEYLQTSSIVYVTLLFAIIATSGSLHLKFRRTRSLLHLQKHSPNRYLNHTNGQHK